MFSEDLVNELVLQSNLFKHQNNIKNDDVNLQEMHLLIAAIIRMGIMKLPQRHLYWSRICKTNFISECMNSRRFKQLFSFLHMNDNTVPSDDKLYKIRLLITNLNKTFESAVKYAKKYSVDESIVLFRGKNILKRYLPGKPHKYGFKIEQLCHRSGYC